MQARSALFDLYGDYLRGRGGRAPIAALVKLLAPLGIAPPAVRTAVSRMVRQGWLDPIRLPAGPGYLLTAKAVRRLDEAAARIYRTAMPSWDGRFDLILIHDTRRRDRQRLGANLAYLGYGRIDEHTWVAPRPGEDVDALLTEAGVRYERFRAEHAGGTEGVRTLVGRAWDLAEIGAAYERFVAEHREPLSKVRIRPGAEEEAYAARFRLVHAWRAFLFRDPQLPPELLPENWPGTAAAAFFDRHAARLRPAADRYVDQCLDTTLRAVRQKGRKP